ncbi:MAG: tRNA (adenosine(37)-N6)-threonylcarbamoyltransferase complex ATPase subunit type 1 TsaE [Xanthomonadales bacterium]|jgi:tRNA threonylcarbamoyladenosine biosynthesis protein TsaE|nr:tRNA (adenosine(37)-N6)-threonylcarbamoyltransferase complex ATPase subunit type 1 TsaE [Xanthomonadales bacterium]
MTDRTLWLADPTATEALGARLAAATTMPLTVALEGTLGAGKSALARAWLQALGVHGRIKSPTYTLIERYPLPEGGLAWHLDLYRIADPEELHHLGLDELVATPGLALIEWPERGVGALPAFDLRVRLQTEGEGRRATLHADSAAGLALLARLAPAQ